MAGNFDKRYSLLAAECLEGLMDEAGIDKAILVGQSLGSFISQRFQLKNPGRVIATAHIGGAEFRSYAGSWAKAFIPITMGMISIMPKNSFYNAFGRYKTDTIETQEYLIEATKKSLIPQKISSYDSFNHKFNPRKGNFGNIRDSPGQHSQGKKCWPRFRGRT